MIGFLKRIYARLTGIPSESIRMEWTDRPTEKWTDPGYVDTSPPPRKKGRGRV